jgi:hypothetical protein
MHNANNIDFHLHKSFEKKGKYRVHYKAKKKSES